MRAFSFWLLVWKIPEYICSSNALINNEYQTCMWRLCVVPYTCSFVHWMWLSKKLSHFLIILMIPYLHSVHKLLPVYATCTRTYIISFYRQLISQCYYITRNNFTLSFQILKGLRLHHTFVIQLCYLHSLILKDKVEVWACNYLVKATVSRQLEDVWWCSTEELVCTVKIWNH